jgi:hypothetical protein
MDLVLCLFGLWLVVMAIGLVIALLPFILLALGFLLTVGACTLLGAVFASAFA